MIKLPNIGLYSKIKKHFECWKPFMEHNLGVLDGLFGPVNGILTSSGLLPISAPDGTVYVVDNGGTADIWIYICGKAEKIAMPIGYRFYNTANNEFYALLQSGLQVTSSTDDQIASEVPFTPNADLVSTDVQSALQELQAEILVMQSVYEVYQIGATPSTGGLVIVGMNTERFASTDYSLNSGQVTVFNDGRYEISYSVSIDGTNAARSVSRVELYSNAVFVPGSRSFTYNRITNAGENTAAKSVFLDLVSGDVVDVRADVIVGTGTAHPTITQSSNLTFRRIL